MDNSFSFLAVSALTIGTLHTLAGPDHYLPFVAMSKTRGWSMWKTINIVVVCGLGHVMSSVLIGFVGIAAGIALSRVEWLEGFRGDLAAWLLFAFGISYMLWGIYRLAFRQSHGHNHNQAWSEKKQMTFWILFTIFVFGPCEPLIPLLMYPASNHNYMVVAGVALLFALSTIATMIGIVVVLLKGISIIRLHAIEKYQHVLAGGTVALCAAAILFLGL